MKYILIVTLVAVIMLIGKGISRQYRERYHMFETINDFFRIMRLNLGFQKQKIKEILNQSSIKNNKEIYSAYYDYLDSGKPLNLDVKVLDDTEQEYITNMLRSLGKNDTGGELKQLDAYDIYLQDKLKSAKQDKDKYCPMITKLSLLFAIGLAILLI